MEGSPRSRGKFELWVLPTCLDMGSPRSRGEFSYVCRTCVEPGSSSPLARGLLSWGVSSSSGSGLTPARAGKSSG